MDIKISKLIENFIDCNVSGVTVECISEYIDYSNKTRYEEREILAFLQKLEAENKVINVNDKWSKR